MSRHIGRVFLLGFERIRTPFIVKSLTDQGEKITAFDELSEAFDLLRDAAPNLLLIESFFFDTFSEQEKNQLRELTAECAVLGIGGDDFGLSLWQQNWRGGFLLPLDLSDFYPELLSKIL